MKYSKLKDGFFPDDAENLPEDVVDIPNEYHTELFNGQATGKRIVINEDGYPVLAEIAEPTEAELIIRYEFLLDKHLDSVAHQYRYDDRKSFALRAGYPGPYQTEGIAFAQWMDECNVLAFDTLTQVQGGLIPMPTEAEFIDSLPEFAFPV